MTLKIGQSRSEVGSSFTKGRENFKEVYGSEGRQVQRVVGEWLRCVVGVYGGLIVGFNWGLGMG